MIDKYCVNLLE